MMLLIKWGMLGTQQKDAETKRLTEQRASAPFIGGIIKAYESN